MSKFLGWYKLNGKHAILNLLLILGVFVFNEPIKGLINALPSNVLKIKPSWWADFLWLSSGIGLLISGWNYEVKGWQKFLNRFLVALGIVLAYSILFRNVYGLVHLKATEWVYYFDIVFFAAASWWAAPLFRFWYEKDQLHKSHKEEKQEEPDKKIFTPFIEDIPTENEDELQRESYAKTLANKILKTTPKRAFNIGIFGEWGSGKSDFIHRIGRALREQKDKEVIIVEFNPWRVGSNSSITEDYLQVLSRHLRPYSSRLSNSIGDYAKQFINNSDRQSTLKTTLNLVVEAIFNSSDKEAQYLSIKDEVKYLNKTIVVFIDDLDRLTKEEIFETFKLIRNVADFPNTFFVLGVDKKYVNDTAFGTILKDQSQRDALEKSKSYLDKIFQHEVPLTKIPGNVYMDAVLSNLETYFPDDADKDVIYKLFYQLSLDNKMFVSFRQIKRFLNRFFLDFESRFLIVVKLDLLILNFLLEFYQEDYERFLEQKHTYSGEGDLENAEEMWNFSQFMISGQSGEIAKLLSFSKKSLRLKSNFYLYFGDALYFQISKESVYNLLNNFTVENIEMFMKIVRNSSSSQLRVYFLLQEIVKDEDELLAQSTIILLLQSKTYILLDKYINKFSTVEMTSDKVELIFKQVLPLTIGINFSDEAILVLLNYITTQKPNLENSEFLNEIIDFYIERNKSVLLIFNFIILNIDTSRGIKFELKEISKIKEYFNLNPVRFTFSDICSIVFRNEASLSNEKYFKIIEILRLIFPDKDEIKKYFHKDLNDSSKGIEALIIFLLYGNWSQENANSPAQIFNGNMRTDFNKQRQNYIDSKIW